MYQFVRCLGIYPIGVLVELESGLVGVVTEQAEDDLLRPVLRIMYNAKKRQYVRVKQVELTKMPNDRITHSVSPEKYGIDLSAF